MASSGRPTVTEPRGAPNLGLRRLGVDTEALERLGGASMRMLEQSLQQIEGTERARSPLEAFAERAFQNALGEG